MHVVPSQDFSQNPTSRQLSQGQPRAPQRIVQLVLGLQPPSVSTSVLQGVASQEETEIRVDLETEVAEVEEEEAVLHRDPPWV